MVQLMTNGNPESQSEKMPMVKMEMEDPLEEEHGPLSKRHKSLGMGGFLESVSQYHPLDEPSPLGLQLRKSPSLLELIQAKLSQARASKVGSHGHGKREQRGGASGSTDKLKASNFPASILRIGTWEYKSRYEGDLVAKCYFAKHKLVWEVLDGGLKNKIEIQWSDIMALKANYPEDGPGFIDVVLARQPLFYRETNPQPRKHTLWQATTDFTGGQASKHRQHYLECPQGLLGKHFEKLIQCDPRLNFLSQQGEITLDSPYFEPRVSVFDDPSENNSGFDMNSGESSSFSNLRDPASPSGAQSSSSKYEHDALGRHSESYPRETPSPSSAREMLTIEDIKTGGMEQLKVLSNWDQIRAPGLLSSMSMSDLVSYLEHRISEQKTSNYQNLSSEEWQSLKVVDDIKQCLFSNSDIQHMPNSDEKSLMSRVNSLCCLLQKDTTAGPNLQIKNGNCPDASLPEKRTDDKFGASTTENEPIPMDESNDTSGYKPPASMTREDSVGELLLNLPRIASLPQFLFNIPEDTENQAR
ncbi:Probable small nuclear ribonucleoprotein G [Olea europaea subsp. europaea]|uniref:Probable small nuclear ribonucleoprotein G n=1 Tax=Olea europaea subsp. europaea TaxID=158383 RepID=A0A8S0PCX3_OLEEU|nr:Probable small nuclear ribonucleoprotein G [Olea europaea subsp. europaea]